MIRNPYSKRNMTVAAVVVLILIIAGSFVDYAVSSAVLNTESMIGKILAAYGQLPTAAASAMIGVLLFHMCRKDHMISSVIFGLLGAVSLLMSIMTAAMDPVLYLDFSMPLAVGLAVIEMAGVSYLTHRVSSKLERRQIVAFCSFLAFVTYGQLIIINVLKPMAARPRMRLLAEHSEIPFQTWWAFNSHFKDVYTAQGIASEEFKSFPSGHAGCAAVSMAFAMIPCLLKKDTGDRWFFIAFVFTVAVMLSRIVMGAHFMSDVGFGLAVTLIMIMIGYLLFMKGVIKDE